MVDISIRVEQLQEAQDNYFITAKYILDLVGLILDCSDRQVWRHFVDTFRNNQIEIDITLQAIRAAFISFGIKPYS
jgi:hypothetical protein